MRSIGLRSCQWPPEVISVPFVVKWTGCRLTDICHMRSCEGMNCAMVTCLCTRVVGL